MNELICYFLNGGTEKNKVENFLRGARKEVRFKTQLLSQKQLNADTLFCVIKNKHVCELKPFNKMLTRKLEQETVFFKLIQPFSTHN